MGNSRISALKALSSIDMTRAASKVCESLIRDLGSSFEIVQFVCSSLDEILELICSPIPIKDVWPEIEEHMSVLLCNQVTGPLPTIFDDIPASDTPSRAIAELMAAHLSHPCFAIAQSAQRSLGNLLLLGLPEASDVLTDCLVRSEQHQESALSVLNAISLTDPDSVSGFRAQTEELFSSPNWLVRSKASSVASVCGWSVPTANRQFKPLPAMHHLELPPRALNVPRDQIGTLLRTLVPNSIDARITVFPLNDQIEFIANIANVREDNLYTRIVEIMRQLAPQETWSAEAQRVFDSTLRSTGLRLPRTPFRLRVARRAMFHAVAELIDTGNITQRGIHSLERHLRTFDPRMVMKEPSHRPSNIAPISDLGSMDDVMKWVSAVEDGLRHANWTPDDDFVVLAESTVIVKRRSPESPRETRYSVLEPVLSSSFPIGRGPQHLYRKVTNHTIEEYETLAQSANRFPLAIENVAPAYSSPGANWIALNPVIARELGWSLATDGMFRWLEARGTTRAESIWWVDGQPAHTTNGPSSEEVGEGWLILATQSAFEEMKRETGPLSRHSIVVRQCHRGGEVFERSAASSQVA